MKLSRAVAGALTLTLFLAPLHDALGATDLAAAESAATKDAGTPDGKKYGEALGLAFGRDHGSTIQKCATDLKRPDLSDFDLFVRVDAAGVIDEALAKPATPLAACVRDKLTGWKAAAPPHPGFWVRIAVSLKPK